MTTPFSYDDYHISQSERWVIFNYTNTPDEHEKARAIMEKVRASGSPCGLVYNTATKNYFLTLSRNSKNLTTAWDSVLKTEGATVIGQAFCGALLVYFYVDEDNNDHPS